MCDSAPSSPRSAAAAGEPERARRIAFRHDMPAAPIADPRQDFPRWYQDVLAKADLAENGPVRGTMTIRPYGYGIWERIQSEIDWRIKRAGAQNVYLPLFI